MARNSERMAVNAAIIRLISRERSEDAARTVIKYGHKLKKAGPIQIIHARHSVSSGDEVTGYVPGRGEMSIQDKEREEHVEWTFGVRKERIGYYRLWKHREGMIGFHHFWKSDPSTIADESASPEYYYLGYDTASLEPKYFAVRRQKFALSIWCFFSFRIMFENLEPIDGTAPTRTWLKLEITR